MTFVAYYDYISITCLFNVCDFIARWLTSATIYKHYCDKYDKSNYLFHNYILLLNTS